MADDLRESIDRSLVMTRRSLVRSAAACCVVSAVPAWADANFAGATLNIIVGFPPGGGVDNGARLIARHLPRFLRGTPKVVVQNMPGAGGAAAADHLFTRAPRDGLTLAVPGRDWPLAGLLSSREVRYQPLDFEYIGSSGDVNTFVWISKSLGIRTPEEFKASKKEVVFGGLTPDTQPSLVPKILSRNGFPARAVSGYRGTAAIINAIESGEVDAIATNEASFAQRPDMMEKTVRVFQLLPSGEKLPLAADYVSDEGKVLLALASYASATGLPLVAPPHSPADRVEALRTAFALMAKDREFAEDAEKFGEPHGSPIGGERIREILAGTMKAATPAALEAFRSIAAN